MSNVLKTELVRIDVVKTYLAQEGLSLDGTDEELTERLQINQMSKKEKVACDVCGGISDPEYPSCPFCGSDDEEEASAPKPAKKAPVKKAPAKKAPAKKAVAKKAVAKKAPAKKAVAEKAPVEKAPVEKAPVEKAPAKKAPVRKKVVAKKAEVVVAPPSEVLDVSALDDAVNEVRDAQERGIRCMWEVGQTLIRIRNSGLYTLRKSDDGSPAYKTWTDFVQTELGMQRSYASRIMDAVENFTEKDVKEVGVTKLVLLLGIKEGGTREKVLESARSGASRSEISDEIKRLDKSEKAKRQPREGFRGGSENMNKGGRPKKSVEITTMITEPERTVELEVDEETEDGDILKGTEVCANGVTIEYVIEGRLLHIKNIRTEEGGF